MRVNNKILFSISNTVRTFEVLFISIFLSRFIDDKNALGELLQIIFISSDWHQRFDTRLFCSSNEKS